MGKYNLSLNAVDDLERIWAYGVEAWGREAADSYHLAFLDHFEELAKNPYLYAETNIREGYRRSICGKDSVFYRLDEETVEIMAIIGTQDLKAWL